MTSVPLWSCTDADALWLFDLHDRTMASCMAHTFGVWEPARQHALFVANIHVLRAWQVRGVGSAVIDGIVRDATARSFGWMTELIVSPFFLRNGNETRNSSRRRFMRRTLRWIGWVGAVSLVVPAADAAPQGPRASPPPRSLNPAFFGRWQGTAPTGALCSGGKRNKRGEPIVTLRIDPPKDVPGKDGVVLVNADWGCFAEMTIPGFIFADELWAASDDRMAAVRLSIKGETLSGAFRFDLNGATLRLDFEDLVRLP